MKGIFFGGQLNFKFAENGEFWGMVRSSILSKTESGCRIEFL